MPLEEMEVLQDIFKSNGSTCLNVESTKSTITKVLTRIDRFQVRVRRHIDENYTDFMPNHSSPDVFLEMSDSLSRETSELLDTVGKEAANAIGDANAELITCTRELREMLIGLRVSEHILKIDDLFQCVEEAKATKDYLVVLDLVGKLRSLIYGEGGSSTSHEVEYIFQQLQCYDTIKVKYHVQAHLLQQNLQERFDRLVQLNSKAFPNSKCVTLQLSKDIVQLQDVAIALFQVRYNPVKLCNFLLENCIEPIITKPVSMEYKDGVEGDTYVQLTLSYSTKECGVTVLRPDYKQVFEHLKLLLQTLSSINVSVSSTHHVLSIIGDHVKDRMLQVLVSECLVPAVPETVEEYQSSTLCRDVAQFEQFLADTFLIILEIDGALTEFNKQYESLYRNRLFGRVLESAREIMQRDLQDMTLVAERNLSSDVAGNPFLFPRCMVSKNALEFVKLMEIILRQPSDRLGDDEGNADPHTGVICMMLNAYVDEVPKIHKKLLDSIPQQSVLFHNNCMFLAHWVTSNANKGIDSFPTLVKMLQTTGSKYFKVQLNHQESILMEIISGFKVDNLHTIGTPPMKLLRLCMRQLELLKNIWQNVLPDNIYNNSFCELLHAIINELIRRIFTIRDISAIMASELSNLIDVVLDKAPLLFKDSHDVIQVRSWMKLQQLKIMMNASLKEFTELWCNGAGPLTANYKADEVKHLIRALFQDTDRRSKALTQIK